MSGARGWLPRGCSSRPGDPGGGGTRGGGYNQIGGGWNWSGEYGSGRTPNNWQGRPFQWNRGGNNSGNYNRPNLIENGVHSVVRGRNRVAELQARLPGISVEVNNLAKSVRKTGGGNNLANRECMNKSQTFLNPSTKPLTKCLRAPSPSHLDLSSQSNKDLCDYADYVENKFHIEKEIEKHRNEIIHLEAKLYVVEKNEIDRRKSLKNESFGKIAEVIDLDSLDVKQEVIEILDDIEEDILVEAEIKAFDQEQIERYYI